MCAESKKGVCWSLMRLIEKPLNEHHELQLHQPIPPKLWIRPYNSGNLQGKMWYKRLETLEKSSTIKGGRAYEYMIHDIHG